MGEISSNPTNASPPEDALIGLDIEGKYRIESLLGEGGMGKVFKVTHITLNKIFALKLMHTTQVSNTNLARFRREAAALARMTHPNVVLVTDFGILNNQSPYLVMEYIEGISLRQLLTQEGRLSERQTIVVAKQICAGLHEAHRNGIIHRDLKPENIMIQQFEDGEKMVRVLDFGIAKLANEEEIKGEESMGTLKYMSPEQAAASQLDARSDIFTLCLILYEMLTGEVPQAMFGSVRPLNELRPEVSPQLSNIIYRGLNKNPEARTKNVIELKRELEDVEQETMFLSASSFSPKAPRMTAPLEIELTTNSYQHATEVLPQYDTLPQATIIEDAPTQLGEDPPSSEEVAINSKAPFVEAEAPSPTSENSRWLVSPQNDFEYFLAGQRAPLIVAAALIAELKQGPKHIAQLTRKWALNIDSPNIAENFIFVRKKIFDIFFYQVVKFSQAEKFFPDFETALVSVCPVHVQPQLIEMLQNSPWQSIRPLGEFKEQKAEFIAQKRQEAVVEVEKFNEKVYQNATYTVLSSEQRYNFEDNKQLATVTKSQSEIRSILSSFVDLIKDTQLKKEILLANESDKYNLYKEKQAFKPESYICQLTELAIALFNDRFLYQAIKIFQKIFSLAHEWQLDLYQAEQFQQKGALINIQNIETYLNSELTRPLVRQIISMFAYWHPQYMLEQLKQDLDRRNRRLYTNLLECYGQSIYPMLIQELTESARSQPGHYLLNIALLLSHIQCPDLSLKDKVVSLLDSYWQKQSPKPLIYQIITTLAFLGTDLACDKLILRLQSVATEEGRSSDLCQKVIIALLELEQPKALETVIDFYQKDNELKQLIDRFSKLYIPDEVINYVTVKLWKEVQRMKYSFSLFGDAETTVELLYLIAHMKNDLVIKLCNEIIEKLSRKHPLVAEAQRVLAEQRPAIFWSNERNLRKLAITKQIPLIMLYINEAGISGQLQITTTERLTANLDFSQGALKQASVPALTLIGEAAWEWAFLLDTNEITTIYFYTNSNSNSLASEIEIPTDILILEGLLQYGEITQITQNYIKGSVRFQQRPVSTFYTNFEQLTETPAEHQLVWDLLAEEQTFSSLQKSTKLSKYRLYQILFYFFKNKMLILDGHKEQSHELLIEDGFVMLQLNMKRIESRPIMFNYYKIAAEIYADLMRNSTDQLLLYIFDVMRRYYLEHYENRQAFTPPEIATCLQVISLVTNYLRNRKEEDAHMLVAFMQKNFQIGEEMPSYEAAFADDPALQVSEVEKLETIFADNDPLESAPSGANMAETLQTLSALLDSEDLDAYSMDTVKNKFDIFAASSVKPLKDFIRELYRNWKAERATSIAWLDLLEPTISLLSNFAARTDYQLLDDILRDLQEAINEQRRLSQQTKQTSFDQEISQKFAISYLKLCEIQPKTFGLAASEQVLAEKKAALIVKFLLAQVPNLEASTIQRLLLLGWNSFDKFMEAKAEELVQAVQISPQLADEICLKAYQYRNIYYSEGVADYEQKFLYMFQLNLKILREVHLALEQTLGEATNEAKTKLQNERQQALSALLMLLLIKDAVDLVQMVQQSVFDVRIQLLENYLIQMIQQSITEMRAQLALKEEHNQA